MLRQTMLLAFLLALAILPAPRESTVLAAAPKAEPRGRVIVAATEQFPRNGEGSFLGLGDGRLVYFYGAWPSTSDTAKETCIAQVVSTDNGDTWSRPMVVLKQTNQDLYHPCAVRTADGAVGLAYTRRRSGTKLAEKVFRSSRDEGATWSKEVSISDGRWKHYITGAHDRLVRLESGRLVIPVFMAELNSAVVIDGRQVAAALVFASDDHGRTWKRMTPDPLCIGEGEGGRSCEEPCIVEHAPGKLLMVLRTPQGRLYESRSEDNGRTWSRPAPSSVPNPRAPARLEKIPGSDALLMIHNPNVSGKDWHKGARVVLAARISRDGGRTWSDPRPIEHTGADTWYDYPSVYWTGDTLHLAYRSVPRGGKGPKGVEVRYQRLSREWLLGELPVAARAIAPKDTQGLFVRVSPRDPRYFELSDGTPYVPIGLNMIAPPGNDLEGMERWLDKLARNRGNFIRVWLSNPFFDVEHAESGRYDAEKAERIDKMLAMARRRGIRVKMCLEHFRHLGEGRQKWAGKPLHHKDHGGPAAGTADFFDNAECRELYKRKIAWYAKRYGDDPTVFAWELWNEMDCITGGDWAAWTEVMLPELHRRFPKNLATQSLGSFDHAGKRERYRRLCAIKSNDLLQVHRYLDLGARAEVCRGPVDLAAADAVAELRATGVRKPILLAESGAVEPSHTGPFKLYAKDTAGIILHDVLFAPFFSGAGGPGHVWHWGVYVDRNDLWRHFGRFAEAIEGIDPPGEAFEPKRIAHPTLRVYALQGRNVLLAWCRDSENTWQSELAEDRRPKPIKGAVLAVDLLPEWREVEARVYDPWTGRWTDGEVREGRLALPTFSRSVVVKLRRR